MAVAGEEEASSVAVEAAVAEKEPSASGRSSHLHLVSRRWESQSPHSFVASRTGWPVSLALLCRCGTLQAEPLPGAVTASGIIENIWS